MLRGQLELPSGRDGPEPLQERQRRHLSVTAPPTSAPSHEHVVTRPDPLHPDPRQSGLYRHRRPLGIVCVVGVLGSAVLALVRLLAGDGPLAVTASVLSCSSFLCLLLMLRSTARTATTWTQQQGPPDR